jgi:hypothetical protein
MLPAEEIGNLLAELCETRDALLRIAKLEAELNREEERLRKEFENEKSNRRWKRMSAEQQEHLRLRHVLMINGLAARKDLEKLYRFRSKAMALQTDSRWQLISEQYSDISFPRPMSPLPPILQVCTARSLRLNQTRNGLTQQSAYSEDCL